jgi:hypothetical protein
MVARICAALCAALLAACATVPRYSPPRAGRAASEVAPLRKTDFAGRAPWHAPAAQADGTVIIGNATGPGSGWGWVILLGVGVIVLVAGATTVGIVNIP